MELRYWSVNIFCGYSCVVSNVHKGALASVIRRIGLLVLPTVKGLLIDGESSLHLILVWALEL